MFFLSRDNNVYCLHFISQPKRADLFIDAEEDGKGKKKDSGKKKDTKKDKKDRGYTMFEPDDSAEESLVTPDEKEMRCAINSN